MKLFETVIYILIGAGIGYVIGLLFSPLYVNYKRNKAEEIGRRNYKNNIKFQEKYQKEIDDKYALALRQKKIIDSEWNTLNDRLKKSRILLKKSYDTAGIDMKYRNIIPIGYMFEFYKLGISRKLTGADGLYYLVRKELRYDSFNCTLSEISSKLDTIIDQNTELYSEIKMLDKTCNSIYMKTIDQARVSAQNNELLQTAVQNSAISAYNTERIKKEMIISNYFLNG